MNVNSSMYSFPQKIVVKFLSNINFFRILQKICLERAQDYAKRVHIEFDKWQKFGYESSYPELVPAGDPNSEKALNDALPKVFRCTVCGKFRAIVDFEKLESIDPAFFVCSDNPDQVSRDSRIVGPSYRSSPLVFRRPMVRVTQNIDTTDWVRIFEAHFPHGTVLISIFRD